GRAPPRPTPPLQARPLLNEPVFLECARALALTTLKLGGSTDAERLTYAFRRCLTRKPALEKAEPLLELFNKETKRFATGAVDPWDVAVSKPEEALALPPD